MPVRYLTTIGASVVAFAPTFITNVDAAIRGSPTAYLLFLPLWGLLIVFGLDPRPKGREINDSEFDRILALVIGIGLIVTASLALPRLPAVSAYWHGELFPLLVWVFAASIVIFGIRRVVRDYLVWLYLIGCFPPNILLLGQALGGSNLVHGMLTVALGAIATGLAFRRNRVALPAAGAYLVLGFVGVYLLRETTVAAYLLPAGVLTAIVIVVRVRFGPAPVTLALPRQSIATIIVGWIAAVLVLVFTPRALPLLPTGAIPVAADTWPARLEADGLRVGTSTTFGWGPSVMGDRGSVQRFPITEPGAGVAYLDVYTTTELGVLASYRRGNWYASAPPAVWTSYLQTDNGHLSTLGKLHSPTESARTPTDSLWTARQWAWRITTDTGTRYQAIYLLASRDPTRPTAVETPQPPTYQSLVLAPMAWLINDRDTPDTSGPVDETDSQTAQSVEVFLTALAWRIVHTAGVS